MDDPLLAELRDRDTHLRVAMDASEVVAYQWDIVNDRVTRMRSSHELGDALENAGTFESVVAKVWPDDQDRFRADIAAALASDDGLYRTECRYQAKDGSIRWVSETGRVLRGPNGAPVRLVGITFDITDRKHAETHCGKPKPCCASRTSARMSSWRCSHTNFEIRWLRFATRSRSCG